MDFINLYFLDVIKNKYTAFDGRARRKEYWMFLLSFMVILIAISIIGAIAGAIAGFLGVIFRILLIVSYLGVLVPAIAVSIRRMHDVGKSGWFILIPIYSIILAVTEGDKGDNEYGSDPKAGERA